MGKKQPAPQCRIAQVELHAVVEHVPFSHMDDQFAARSGLTENATDAVSQVHPRRRLKCLFRRTKKLARWKN